MAPSASSDPMLLRSGKRKREDVPPSSTSLKSKRKRLPSPSTTCSKEHQCACSKSPPSASHRDVRDTQLLENGSKGPRPLLPVQSQESTDITEPESKKTPGSPRKAVDNPGGAVESDAIDPVKHWIETGHWPPAFATMSQDSVLQKRSRTPSYSQSVRDGDAPRAYSPAFETILVANGVFMDELKGRSLVAESSKALCTRLLEQQHPVPTHTSFPLSEFLSVWQQVQNRNEGRVYRDLTPLLVPSPALLSVSGSGEQVLKDIAEEISVEWSKCKTLGGPKPKPDFALGISPSAFNDEESAKLQNYASFERLARFTDNILFPFLLCEVKCGNEGINRADRQNMHSSSMAVRAIVKLLQSLGGNHANDLNGQILVFSISHDNERVKIYGHFPILSPTTNTTACYRFPVASFVLNFDGSQGWKKTADFVREVYKTFGEDRSHEAGQSVTSSSYDPAVFKIPDLPASKKQKGELSVLQELLAQQKAQLKMMQEQMEEQRKQSQEQLAFLQQQLKHSQDQLDEQRKQHQEQIEAQRKQSQDQIELLNQLLKRS
ncbi:hypothetical protein DV738_g3246, partial [Chaetothyriales sp. CBS 135597]